MQRRAKKSGERVVHLGAISVLSGEGAAWGVNHQRGTQLAAEQFNASGGINGKRIEIDFEDSPNGIARHAVSAYRKLLSNGSIHFILGPVMMDELLAVMPLAKRDKVFVGGATYMPNPPDNFFSTWIDADIESDRIATVMLEKFKRVAVLSSQQSWETQIGHRFRDTFTELGGEVVALEEPSFEATQVKSEILKTKQKQPEALFISSYLLLPKYLKEAKTVGMNVPLYSIELDQTVIDSTAGSAEGLTFIAPSSPSDRFIKVFKDRWNANPDIPAASSFDAASLLFTALRERGEDVDEIIDYFKNFRGYDGATGRIERKDGKTVIGTSLYVVTDGKIQRQGPAQ